MRPVLLLSSLAALALLPARGVSALPRSDGPAVLAAYERLAQGDLWPGFQPLAIPRAVFDGERTWLAGHPEPPAGFVPLDEGLWMLQARADGLHANTSFDLGGVPTAGLLSPPADVDEAAAVLVHEAFHVFQRQTQPGWSGNEAALLVYPLDDAQALALRRLETAMLAAALADPDDGEARAQAAMAVLLRARRLSRLPAEVARYERRTELNEGLAQYVQRRARPHAGSPALPAEGFPAAAVRARCYESGHALALLLDRFRPAWRQEVGPADDTGLDERLLLALDPSALPADWSIDEERVRAEQARALAEVEALAGERARWRSEYVGAPGFRVLVRAAEAPLGLSGFDPMNVDVLGDGELLHRRFLSLERPDARLLVERAALTRGNAVHPLFAGVGEVLVTGLPGEPEVTEDEDGLHVRAEGLQLDARGARLERDGERLTVVLAAPG